MSKILEVVQKHKQPQLSLQNLWSRIGHVLSGTHGTYRAMEAISCYTHEELIYLLDHRTDRTYKPEQEKVIRAYRSAQLRGNKELEHTMDHLIAYHAEDIHSILTDVFTKAKYIESQITDAPAGRYARGDMSISHLQVFARTGYSLDERKNIYALLPASSFCHTIDDCMDYLLSKPDLKPSDMREVNISVSCRLKKNIIDCTLQAVHTYGGSVIGTEYLDFHTTKYTIPMLLLHEFLVAHHPINFAQEIKSLL